jgi:hypothetical protein
MDWPSWGWRDPEQINKPPCGHTPSPAVERVRLPVKSGETKMKWNHVRNGHLVLVAGLGVALFVPSIANGQLASALLREDDELLPGEEISSLSNTAVNHVGGYACSMNTVGTATVSRIWGNPDGGMGMLLRSEGTIGDFLQTSFESFYGMGDLGELAYGTTSTRISSGETGLDGVWLDDLAVLHEEDPVPTLPGQFSTFNSRPTASGNGNIVWVGGISATQGGSSQNRCLFSGVGASVLIMGGDFLPGIDEPLKTSSSNIDFDFRVSRFDTYWINQVRVDTSSTNDGVMVINGVPIMTGGGMMREDTPISASVGGLPDERWDNFDFFGINEAQDFLVTGDTSAASSMDEFVSLNGEIILREGTVLDLDGMPVTLDGSIEGGYMNKEADWAVIWDFDDADGDNFEALLLNGEILLVEGDPVDWNGDGVIDGGDNDGVISNFTARGRYREHLLHRRHRLRRHIEHQRRPRGLLLPARAGRGGTRIAAGHQARFVPQLLQPQQQRRDARRPRRHGDVRRHERRPRHGRSEPGRRRRRERRSP